MRRALLALLLGLLALPLPASAGNQEEPEMMDPPDQALTPADLLAAWFEAEETGLRFFVQTTDGSRPDRYPGHVYWVAFRVGREDVRAAVGFGTDGHLRGHLGPDLQERGGFDAWANGRVVDLREDRGRPSTWSGLVPWESAPGLEPGARLTDLRAWTSFYNRRTGAWNEAIDVAAAPGPFVAQPPRPLLPILVPAWVIPTLVASVTLLGAAGGFAFSRRLAAPPAEAGPPGPNPVPVPPRGRRFRRDPRERTP